MWKKAGQEGRPIGIFFVQRDDTEGRRIAHEVAKEFRAQNEKTVWAEAFVDDFAERLGENWGITGTVLPPCPLAFLFFSLDLILFVLELIFVKRSLLTGLEGAPNGTAHQVH